MICTRKLNNGDVRYFARITDPATGKKVTGRSYNRKKDAKDEETLMKVRIYRGEPPRPEKDVAFEVFAAEDRSRCTAEKKTVDDYERIDRFFSSCFGHIGMRSVSVKDCENAVGRLARDKAPVTVDKYVIRLRSVFRRAAAYGLIASSPADKISNKPKVHVKRQIQTLEQKEITALLEATDDYWRPLFTLWLVSGLRRSEIFGLTLDCLDVQNCQVHVRQQLNEKRVLVPYTKSRRPRTIPIAPEIMALVREHCVSAPHVDGSPDLVFPSKSGLPVHYSDWNRDVFKPLVKGIGRPSMVTHDLRHTFASQALSQGVNIKTLQVMLGHADASLTLNRYGHLIPSDARIAAEKMSSLVAREEFGTRIGHSNVIQLDFVSSCRASYQRKCTTSPRSSGDRAQVS